MIKVAKTKSFVVLLVVVVMEPPPGPACRVRTLHPGWETLDVVLTSEVPRKYQIMIMDDNSSSSMLWQWTKIICITSHGSLSPWNCGTKYDTR